VSTARPFGILALAMCSLSLCLHGQNFPFPANVPPQPFSGPLLTAAGDTAIAEFPAFAPGPKPISGVISLRELEHPIPRKAARLAYQAQQLARSDKIPQAIAKFEKALRVYPRYRDARVNLGVQYALLGRIPDARAEFQKALEIGPPAAPIYFDLALTSLYLKQYREAAAEAQKALDLDPANRRAQQIVQDSISH